MSVKSLYSDSLAFTTLPYLSSGYILGRVEEVGLFFYAACWPVFLLFCGDTKSKLDPGVANLATMLGNSCGGKSQIQ